MLISTSKFFKDKKISQACSAYLHQIAQEIVLLLDTNLNEKCTTESQDGRNFGRPALFVIVVNVALHEKCTHLQPIRCA